MDALEALGRAPLFRGLTREDLAPLAARARRQEFRKGTIVYLEGDPGDLVQIVVEGNVKMSRVSSDGDELVAEYGLPGYPVGIVAALIDGATRMTQGVAVEDTVLLALDRGVFLRFLERHPLVMRRTLSDVARIARSALGTATQVGLLDVPGRVAQKLLDLAELYGEQTSDGTNIGFRLTQRALAAMIATSREKVNRALGRLVEEGIIRQDAGALTIIDIERLRKRV